MDTEDRLPRRCPPSDSAWPRLAHACRVPRSCARRLLPDRSHAPAAVGEPRHWQGAFEPRPSRSDSSDHVPTGIGPNGDGQRSAPICLDLIHGGRSLCWNSPRNQRTFRMGMPVRLLQRRRRCVAPASRLVRREGSVTPSSSCVLVHRLPWRDTHCRPRARARSHFPRARTCRPHLESSQGVRNVCGARPLHRCTTQRPAGARHTPRPLLRGRPPHHPAARPRPLDGADGCRGRTRCARAAPHSRALPEPAGHHVPHLLHLASGAPGPRGGRGRGARRAAGYGPACGPPGSDGAQAGGTGRGASRGAASDGQCCWGSPRADVE
mmetsp:Transcript_53047/g.113393  ORF Transcript_53047/g.113393 Transcript_53047/m.113393 type:complete len:323 (+) Transcript_53047:292-1260(+)